MCRIGYRCYGVYLQACMGFIWSDCLDCVPVFLLISFWFLFVLWLVFGVCVLSCYGYGGEWGKKEEKRLLLLLFFFTLPCVGIVCGEEWGRGGFLCVGHVRCASAGLCVGHCVLSPCLWGVLWPSRAFSCSGRVFICLSRESVSEWISGGPCHFLPFCRFCLSSSHFVALFRMGAVYVLYSHPC